LEECWVRSPVGFDKIAGSDFEQRSAATLAPQGWSTGTYGIIPPSPPYSLVSAQRHTIDLNYSREFRTIQG